MRRLLAVAVAVCLAAPGMAAINIVPVTTADSSTSRPDAHSASMDDVYVTSNPIPNAAPQVTATAPASITLPKTAALSGTATDDGLPDPPGVLRRTWHVVSGPGTVTFADANAPNTTAAFRTNGTYVLQLGALGRSRTAC